MIFGAGRIGRSFLGQLFSAAGYRVMFVDVDRQLVDRLNERKNYPVFMLDSNHPDRERTIQVRIVGALHAGNEEEIIRQIEEADVLATSVGKNGLLALTGILGRGIRSRYSRYPGRPIDIILAENVRHAGDLLLPALQKEAAGCPVKDYVGLVETSIGKMVPIMTREQMAEDPLAVYAEPYHTLILDARAFRNPVPDVPGLSPKSNMKAWVDRKLFIHNLGHAVLAYQANFHFPDLIYTWEALEQPELHGKTRAAMLQSAVILEKMYPQEYDLRQLVDHTDDLLMRFANKALGDTIFRVGCDLKRKLGRDDRLMVPILAGISLDLPYDLILEAWVRGCSFNATGEDGLEMEKDRQFRMTYGLDYRRILREHCQLPPLENTELYQALEKITTAL